MSVRTVEKRHKIYVHCRLFVVLGALFVASIFEKDVSLKSASCSSLGFMTESNTTGTWYKDEMIMDVTYGWR